jgi:hypothetical protein
MAASFEDLAIALLRRIVLHSAAILASLVGFLLKKEPLPADKDKTE